MQYDVFISYARKDYEDLQTKEIIPGNIVSRIKQLLDDNKLTYWFDEAGIYSGDQFAGVIADAIEQSTVFLYISTTASNDSKWTINEIATAKHLDKKIIPFRYDESKYNKSILMYLAPLDHIEYPKNKDKAFGQLIASIKTYKHTLELAEQESRRAAELAKQREQEKLEKQKQELEKQLRIQEVNKQLETLYTEIQKKQQERASINIVLDGLEKQRTNLENELAFLTGKASSFEPIIQEDVVVVPGWKGTLSSIWETTKRYMRRLYHFLLAIIAGIAILFGIILSLPSVRYDTPEEMYQRGNTFSQKGNIKKTIRWYRKAAEQGHADAQVNMGTYSIQGVGVDCDTIQAIEWYRKAAEQGHAEAQYNMGTYSIQGVGVDCDTIQAVEWYQKAAEQGHKNAQLKLAVCYKKGNGVSQDYDKALELYREVYGGDYAFYNVSLNNQWDSCHSVENLNTMSYDAYQSFSNRGKAGSRATMYIDVIGLDTFMFYIHANSESCDGLSVSHPNWDMAESQYRYTRIAGDGQTNNITNYKSVKYTNLSGKKARITIWFEKDRSIDEYNDCGYIIIPKDQGSLLLQGKPSTEEALRSEDIP